MNIAEDYLFFHVWHHLTQPVAPALPAPWDRKLKLETWCFYNTQASFPRRNFVLLFGFRKLRKTLRVAYLRPVE